MSPARIAVLSLAFVVAIAMAVIIHRLVGAKRPIVETAEAAPIGASQVRTPHVLVAKRDLLIGARLTADDLGWQSWPLDGLNPSFVTDRQPVAPSSSGSKPGAGAGAEIRQNSSQIESFVGAVVRESIVSGEPILPSKLVRNGGAGELAVVLPAGMQALRVPVKTENGTGSFILPGDRVDVRQVDRTGAGAQARARATIVLRNVRVLAFEQSKRPDGSPSDGWVATLEVDAVGGDALVEAMAGGDLHLALRSYADDAAASGLAQAGARAEDKSTTVTIFSQDATTEVQVRR